MERVDDNGLNNGLSLRRIILDAEKLFHQVAANAFIIRYKSIQIEDVARDSASKNISLDLYLHTPFCRRICDYCAYERISAPPKIREQFVAGLVDYLPQILPPYYLISLRVLDKAT